MLGIITRFKDIMSSNINALLDKAENPSKMIDQYLRNLESDLGKVKAETSSVMAEETRAKRELNECIDEISKMQRYAEKAILAGNDSDAKLFLEKKKQLANQQETLQQSYEISSENAAKMRSMHNKLVKDIAELNVRRDQLREKLSVAKTQERLNKIGSSVNGTEGNMSAFDKMEEKINRQLDKANAMAELNSFKKEDSIEDLMSKYDNDEPSNSEIDDELQVLKNKLGL